MFEYLRDNLQINITEKFWSDYGRSGVTIKISLILTDPEGKDVVISSDSISIEDPS